MKPVSGRLAADRLGLNFTTVVVVVGSAAAAWLAGVSAPTTEREADLERFAEIARTGPLASLLTWWSAFSAEPWHVGVLVGAAQIGCCLGVAYFAWRYARSTAVALIAGLVTVASPFPRHWVTLPSGLVDTIASAAMLVVLTAVLDLRTARRTRIAVISAAAFVGVLVSGWAALPLVVIAVVLRDAMALPLAIAILAALGGRLTLGIPADAIAGHWSTYSPHAVGALRALVATVVVTPVLVFAITHRRFEISLLRERTKWAVLAASGALFLTCGFLVSDWASLFSGQLAVTLVAIAVARRDASTQDALVRITLGAAAAAAIVAGFAVRLQPLPADDLALRTRERALVRSVGPSFVVVDHGDATIRVRYGPSHLAFLAGRPVDVRYGERPPLHSNVPVLDANADGLLRIDDVLRRIALLEHARRNVRFDIMASSTTGVLSSRVPQSTPNGLGVIPRIAEAGPNGLIDSIVTLSGFSDTFENVRAYPGDRLVYLVAKALDVGNEARGTAVIEIPGRPALIINDDLPPARPHGSLAWQYRDVPLPVREPTSLRIRFTASSPSGANFGDWVAFAGPAVVRQ